MKASECFKLAAAMTAAVICFAQGARASTAAQIADYITDLTYGDLITAVSGETVTVTGSLSGAPSTGNYLTLNIDEGVTVIWRATLRGSPGSTYALVNISGGPGAFQAESGAIVNTGTGRAITDSSACVIAISGDAQISSKTTISTSGTIYLANLANTGAAAAERLVIAGGTVENTGSGNAIYNASTGAMITVSGGTVSATSGMAINNNNAGTITVSGGAVGATTGMAIHNSISGGSVTISGGTVSATTGRAINNNSAGTVTVSGGTVSATTGRTVYNYAGKVTVSGGTVSATTGRAAFNYASAGTITVSDSAKVTSANTQPPADSGGTIHIYRGTLNMDGGTVENTASGAGSVSAIATAYAIATSSSVCAVNISGGTVKVADSHAIYNADNCSVNISGGTVSAPKTESAGDKVAVYNKSGGAVKITGGTLEATIAVYSGSASVTVTLGGSPTILGGIYHYPEKLSVLTGSDDPDKFSPGQKLYRIRFVNGFSSDLIAVVNGRNFLNNFAFYGVSNWDLYYSGANLISAAAAKVSFDLNCPVVDEDFDGSEHSFTIENGSETNQWAVGTAAGDTKSAYISNDGGTTYGYTITSKSVVHMYRAVTFPASSLEGYTISFNWKGVAEFNSSDDYGSVRLAETSDTPTAGTVLSSGTELRQFIGRYDWAGATANIPASYSGTTKLLVFTWYNDYNYGNSESPIAVDNILLTAVGPEAIGALPGRPINSVRKPSTSSVIRSDYVNDGKWYLDPTGETEFVFGDGGTAVQQDMTLYLKWIPSSGVTAHAVTFSAGENGALAATVDGSAITSGAEVEHGKSVVFTATPAEGYGVIGWTLNGAAVSGNTENTYTLAGVSAASAVTVSFGKSTSVSMSDQVIPTAKPTEEATVIAPMVILAGEFTAGPNPVNKSSGNIAFFRQGKRISGTLVVYDASGNVINRIKISDKAIGNQSKRKVGAWDLTDKKGRPVPEGTYLLKGVIKTSDGKSEKVSVIVGVR
jgi:hypothetical protein